MMTNREDIARRVSTLLGDRPVRWLPRKRLLVDFDGSSRTLEVFNADAGEQRALLHQLRPHRAALETAAGGPIVIIFHTSSETQRLYGELLTQPARSNIEPSIIDWVELPPPRARVLSPPLRDQDVSEGEVAPQRRVA